MSSSLDHLWLYLHLARASELRRRPLVRDRLLVIAAAQAIEADLPRIAQFCRQKILQHNPGHMLRRWENVQTACDSDDFPAHLRQLQRRYPPEKAEQMLQSLEVLIDGQREAYYDDEEYAASIWGISRDQLDAMFPSPPQAED